MDIWQSIKDQATIPLSHQYLLSKLTGFKRPNDKIHEMMKKRMLTPLKKGLYIPGPVMGMNSPEPWLIANHLLGPSYVSAESALHYYDLIPERVYETVSMTTKAARVFSTPIGRFRYIKLRIPYYSLGILQQSIEEGLICLMASPEKSLIDKIITTPHILFRSKKEALKYLTEDLRIDETDLKKMDTKVMMDWLPVAPKQETILFTIQAIKLL